MNEVFDRLPSQRPHGAASAEGVGAEPQPDVAVVDYSDLVARCMGNLEFAEKILGKFEERLEEDLGLLENEVNQHDAAGIARVAHRLKGASANVSASRLCDVLSRLEQLGRTEQLQQVPACMDELRSEWNRFKARSSSYPRSSVTNDSSMAAEY